MNAYRARWCSVRIGVIVVASLWIAACGESQLGGDVHRYGHVHDEPKQYATKVLTSPWVNDISLAHGSANFGDEIVRQVRIDVNGTGSMAERDLTLQTPPASDLCQPSNHAGRCMQLVHGMLDTLDKRGGYIRGLSLVRNRAGFEAAALSPIVEKNVLDGVLTSSDRNSITHLLSYYARSASEYMFAWYDFRTNWMTVGPDVTRTLRAYVLHPSKVTPGQGVFAAFVLRHEMEHAVTPVKDDEYARLRWLEEGTADTLARWPGAAGSTAKAMGLPYPKRYDRIGFESKRAGYPPFVASVRMLLQAVGIDSTRRSSLDEATELLQGRRIGEVSKEIARRISERHGLGGARESVLATNIELTGSNPKALRRLLLPYL